MKKKTLLLGALLAALGVATPVHAGWFDHWIQRHAVNEIITNVQLENVAEQYERFYAVDAQFNDPTATVDGRDAIIAHLQTALTQVSIDEIRVTDTLHGRDGTWVVLYEMDSRLLVPVAPGVQIPVGEQFTLIAATTLVFNDDNEVVYHRDYWDQFVPFEQIPGFGEAVQGMVGAWIGEQLGGGGTP